MKLVQVLNNTSFTIKAFNPAMDETCMIEPSEDYGADFQVPYTEFNAPEIVPPYGYGSFTIKVNNTQVGLSQEDVRLEASNADGSASQTTSRALPDREKINLWVEVDAKDPKFRFEEFITCYKGSKGSSGWESGGSWADMMISLGVIAIDIVPEPIK
ncbi:hypothetical protein TWF481_010311 [Arthrobotrys musiformis]|uniref:Uncharacterized protein n=1 Tax=Arthrobotrys musiformis TaxID=47236 RepID=A0AAV9W1S9_9PEZI